MQPRLLSSSLSVGILHKLWLIPAVDLSFQGAAGTLPVVTIWDPQICEDPIDVHFATIVQSVLS